MANKQTVRRSEWQLQPRPEAARQARAAVAPFLSGFAPDAAFRARLAVSELVANCVRHVRFPLTESIKIRFTRSADTIRVEVEDPDGGRNCRGRVWFEIDDRA